MRYLSLAWIDAVAAAVAANERDPATRRRPTRSAFTQVVTDGPEGDVTYHLQVGDGASPSPPAPPIPEHVRMEQSWDTAVAVATGTLNAQEAFVSGQIRLRGDQQRLLDSQRLFGALDAVFSAVREETEYE